VREGEGERERKRERERGRKKSAHLSSLSFTIKVATP